MSDITSLWPAWTALGVGALVTLNQLLTESEKFANLLGSVGRKFYARSKLKYQMDQIQFSTAVRAAVNDERKRWEEDESRALAVVTGQMAYVSSTAEEQQKQLEGLSFQIRCMTAYVEYEANWHHQLRMQMLRADSKNDGMISIETLPNHMDYSDFEGNCKKFNSMAWRSWGI
jgi:uncharacterized phage-like protein YoqJ